LGTVALWRIFMSVRRNGLIRFITALWSLWFAAAILELPGVHACAVHDGAAGHSHQASAPQAAHSHHHGAPEGGAPAHSQQCTCLAHCCGASPVAVSAPTFTIELSTRVAPRVVSAPRVVIAISRPYVRPFANGPPVA
jgi:hypothetical protein